MKQSVYSPDEKIQYHTKTFSLSEEIGLACDPNPSLPLQFHHTSKEGLTSTSHSHISSAKRPFISSLKLFEQDPSRKEGFLGSRENSRKQTSSIEGSLLDATRLKMTSPLANSKLSNEKSHNLERSELSSSQLEQVKKFPYNSHLNIVNSNVLRAVSAWNTQKPCEESSESVWRTHSQNRPFESSGNQFPKNSQQLRLSVSVQCLVKHQSPLPS